MNLSRMLAVAKKEVMHILRDPFTIGMAVGLPVVLVVIFGFAIDFDFRGVRIAIYDQDHSRQSRDLVQRFSSSAYFVPVPGGSAASPLDGIESAKNFAALIINPDYGRDYAAGRVPAVQVLMDGTDNQKTGIVSGYIAGIAQYITRSAAARAAQPLPPAPVTLETRLVYNPELNTRWFIVPGLMVIVTGLLAIMMTALTVAREWENGSMELLLSTPVTPGEIVVGKILPYVALGFTGIAFVYAIARLIFGVPFLGSYVLFIAACLLYITASLALGLFISVVTRQQQKAMQFSLVSGVLPALLLSGFIFPIESMPAFFRYLTMLLPPRWFMQILRGVMLKGAGLADLILPFAALVAMNVVLVAAAAKRFKKDVEP